MFGWVLTINIYWSGPVKQWNLVCIQFSMNHLLISCLFDRLFIVSVCLGLLDIFPNYAELSIPCLRWQNIQDLRWLMLPIEKCLELIRKSNYKINILGSNLCKYVRKYWHGLAFSSYVLWWVRKYKRFKLSARSLI